MKILKLHHQKQIKTINVFIHLLWIITQNLNNNFGNLENEKIYKENKEEYYNSINIGVNFYELNYQKANNFFKIIPQNLKQL